MYLPDQTEHLIDSLSLSPIDMDPKHPTPNTTPSYILPTSSELLTSIINQLSTINPPAEPEPSEGGRNPTQSRSRTSSNPLSSLPTDTLSKAKPLLLTLHCLFPNELLLALDILDKKLVKKCSVSIPPTPSPGRGRGETDVYFVRSQSTLSSSDATENNSTAALKASYEVHLQAWNCTCEAFTLAAVRGMDDDDEDENDDERFTLALDQEEYAMDDWLFGGTLTTGRGGRGPPAVCCKHLLACVLVARCPNLFARGLEELVIELGGINAAGSDDGNRKMYEIAAWHAGWDD